MKLSELTHISVCDRCKKTFNAKDVKLIKSADNFDIAVGPVIVYDIKNEKIMQTSYSAITEDDMLLACPYCGLVHLFGFDLAKAEPYGNK